MGFRQPARAQGRADEIAPTADGRVVRKVGFSLAGLEAGPFDLVLDVQDEVSGARLKHRESFALVTDVTSR